MSAVGSRIPTYSNRVWKEILRPQWWHSQHHLAFMMGILFLYAECLNMMKRASFWYSSDDDRSGFYKRNMIETLLKLETINQVKKLFRRWIMKWCEIRLIFLNRIMLNRYLKNWFLNCFYDFGAWFLETISTLGIYHNTHTLLIWTECSIYK